MQDYSQWNKLNTCHLSILMRWKIWLSILEYLK